VYGVRSLFGWSGGGVAGVSIACDLRTLDIWKARVYGHHIWVPRSQSYGFRALECSIYIPKSVLLHSLVTCPMLPVGYIILRS
jgi:hypothetical protein